MIVIDLGYKSIVLNREDAVKLVEILEKAEVYERKWWSADKRKEKGMDDEYTYHVYSMDNEMPMRLITNDHYRLAKLAGKPAKD